MRRLIVTGLAAVLGLLACPQTSVGPDGGPTGCASDGCAAPLVCNQATGACETLPECSTQSQCPGASLCVGGVCRTCETARPCTAGLTTCDPATARCIACTAGSCSGEYPRCGLVGCAQCVNDQDCGGATPTCYEAWCAQCDRDANCATGSCVAGVCRARCSQASECDASAPFCESSSCVECRTTEDCPAPTLCYRGTCRPGLPGDACRNAIPLAFSSGRAEVEGALPSSYLADSPIGSVLPGMRDVFYRVTVPTEGALTAEVRSEGLLSQIIGVGVYTGACGALRALDEGAGEVRDVFVVPGEYYVRVSGDYFSLASQHRFVLSVSFGSGARQVGNHCFKPQPVSLPAMGGMVSVTGDTTGQHSVTPDYCDVAAERPDAVYALDLPYRAHLDVTVTPGTPAGDFLLELKTDCLLPFNECRNLWGPGQPETLSRGPLDPGRYFVLVRTLGPPGPYTLDVDVHPWATNATCASAVPLTLTGGAATVQGNTAYTDTDDVFCGNGGVGPSQHYTLSTVGLGAKSLAVDVLGPPGRYPPALAVYPGCGSASNQALTCRYASAGLDGGRLEVPDLPEGTYDLQVFSESLPFTMNVTLAEAYPLPVNDTCNGVTTLGLGDGGFFSGAGDTRGAGDHVTLYCNGAYPSVTTRDVVFRIPTPPGKSRVEVTAVPTTPGFDLALSLQRNIGSGRCSTQQTQCANAAGEFGAETASERYRYADDGGVFIWVDGVDVNGGQFTLSGRVELPPPGDECTAPAPLASGTTNGTLTTAFEDRVSVCSGSLSGPDVYYRLTAPSNGAITLTLDPVGFDGALQVLSACGAGSTCVGSANAGGVGALETLTFPASRNTSYIVGVGSAVGSSGTYTLTVAP